MANKVDTTARKLVADIKDGKLRLPEMQRSYVWTATQVRDLLDSMYRDYPTGTILVWETTTETPERSFAVGQSANVLVSTMLLLDGQQRLTSLASIFNAEPVTVRNKKKPIEILFNLDHPDDISEELTALEEAEDILEGDESDNEVDEDDEAENIQEKLAKRTFVVSAKNLVNTKSWIKITDIFNPSITESKIIKSLGIDPDDERWDKYSERIQKVKKIQDYQFVMYVLGQQYSYEEVAEIFVRVNSSGTKLRGSDLALAQITARWKNSLKEFEAFSEVCSNTGMNIDTGLLVRALVVYATGQCRFKIVNSVPLDKFQSSWKEVKEGVEFAINFLQANGRIEDVGLLSSPYFIIPIALFSKLKGGKLSNEEGQMLLKWLYVAHAKGHYSRGSSESILDADLNILKRSKGPGELLDLIGNQFGRITLEESEMAGKGVRSPFFSLAYIALRKAGAKDWYSKINLSLAHIGKKQRLQFHHIFPKSLLQKEGLEKSEINDLSNMAFISGAANRSITNKKPIDYLQALEQDHGKEILELQCIPMDKKLWEIDRYKDFLSARRTLLLSRIKSELALE